MDRFDTPDVFVGVGGAGSRIVYEFLEQDWVLESAVGAGQFAGADPQQLEAYTIDSALDDSVHDRIGAIQETIDGLVSDHDSIDKLIDVSLEHYSMTGRVPQQWRQTNMLTADENIRQLLKARQMNAWWFKEGREPLQKMSQEGFSGGVYRRRAVSKALFHLAEHAGEGVTPPSDVGDEVAMVAALGGGTGSGTIVDLAVEMEADQIDLFAVIPTTGEKQKEKANAFAALSELEYLETNGESPFRTITLIPYLGGSGGDGQATDEEAAMAAVRTIVAHHQAMRGENLRDMLNTSSRNGPPSYSSFAVAAPKTIEFNIEKKDRAKAEIKETLQQRRTELRAEANLCDLTSAFLDREFPDALDDVAEPSVDERRQAVIGLSQRVERLFEETLQQEEIIVAGVEDQRDQIVDLYERISESVLNGSTVDGSDFEEAQARATTVTDRLRTQIVPSDQGDEGSVGRRLAEVVQRELSVVNQRYELLERIYRLPAVADRMGLEEDEAVTLRDVLIDVVLDPTENLLGAVQNPAFTVVFDQYKEDRDELVQKHRQYEAFESALRSEVADRVSSIRNEIRDDLSKLATVDRRFPGVGAATANTVDRIDELVAEVRGTVDDILTMQRPGNVEPTLSFDEFDELNEDLSAAGVDEIDGDELQRGLNLLIDAKNASLDHNSGFLPGRPDRSQDFQNAVAQLQGVDGFVVGAVPEVDEPFEAGFDADVLRRGDELAERRREAIDNIVDTSLRQVCQAEDELFVPDTREQVENALNRSPEYIRVTTDPPTGITATRLGDRIRKELRESREGDVQIRLEELFPPLSEADHKRDTVTAQLAEAYLRPVGSAVDEIEADLEQLGDNEVADSEGVIEMLRRLRALAGRFEQAEVRSELPSVTGASEDEVYGGDFSEIYEGDYEFNIGLVGSTRREDHPYVHDRDADMSDLAGSPDDIEESQVLENRHDDIFGLLGRSAEELFDGTYGRAPVEEFEPQGHGTNIDAVYRDMRYVNVFFSRALDERENLTPEDGTIHPDVADVFRQNTPFEGDTYGEAQFSIGGPDGVTMVTFVGGLTLDNISRVSGADGYQNTYDRMRRNHSFLPTHHTVGLGGNWGRWEKLREWTAEERGGPTYGAYLYRDTIRRMNPEFVTELQQRDDQEVVELLGEMTTAETFDSTIDSTGE